MLDFHLMKVKINFFRESFNYINSLGYASPTDVFHVFFAERSIWHIEFNIPGNPGHGSLLLKNTAGEKLQKLLSKFYQYRDSQIAKLEGNAELTIGDVTTINATV